MEPLPPPVLALLEHPNPAVVATVRSDGAPVSAPVWYRYLDGEVLLTMGRESPRRRQLERDGRFALTVLDAASWYRQVTLRCRVSGLADDADFVVTDLLSRHYEGRPWGDRSVLHAAARARVVGWSSFGVD